MEEKNELGDIILNKNSKSGGKKVILVAATLGIILIIVVLLMNTLSSDNQNNLPHNALPPKAISDTTQSNVQKEEPLFEDVEVIDEKGDDENEKLEKIANELKEQNTPQEPEVEEVSPSEVEVKQPESKPAALKKEKIAKKATPKQNTHKQTYVAKKAVATGHYYVQVGSFTRFKPNEKFLSSIKREGYSYIFHKTSIHGRNITKVLVGPFKSEREARSALVQIRKRIEKGAFLTKL